MHVVREAATNFKASCTVTGRTNKTGFRVPRIECFLFSSPVHLFARSSRTKSTRSSHALSGRVTHPDHFVVSCSAIVSKTVVLTREAGKNGELAAALAKRNICTLELPLIEATIGPDREQLPRNLVEDQFDWIVLTSPEAAAVFLEGWRTAGQPKVRIACVGGGTSRVLLQAPEAYELTPQFQPSKANAEHLAAELPQLPGSSQRVLYPASAKASTGLQEGLGARGFEVVRLNTYNTQPVASVDDAALRTATSAAVVTFASPSAVKAWARLLEGLGLSSTPAVACIGSTSARAAQAAGLGPVCFPDAPGLDGFVDAIVQALHRQAGAPVAHH